MFDYLCLTIIWILLAVATYAVAECRGRQGGVWFYVGLLLGPVGLLIAALQERRKRDERPLDGRIVRERDRTK